MSDTLTSLFVVSKQNATIGNLPTTGSTQNLVAGQTGIFLPDNTPATVANVGNAKYIYIAQGRNIATSNEGSRKSDFIIPSNVIDWYKVSGGTTVNPQVTKVNGLSVACQQDFSLTIRLDSYYIRAAYHNSLTRTVMVTAPCCNCGANPCDTLQASDLSTIYNGLAAEINSDPILNQFITAGVDNNANATALYIQGKTLQTYGQGTSVDLTNFPFQYDRLTFWTYLMEGPNLTTDYETLDYCNNFGTVAIMQRASFPQNTPAEIAQLEKDFWSYQSEYKHIFSNVNFNGEFQTYLDSTAAYNLYYIRFRSPSIGGRDIGVSQLVESVIIAIPTDGAGTAYSGIPAILSVFLGSPDPETTVSTSSSTTYTTSSSTSTTTTIVQAP